MRANHLQRITVALVAGMAAGSACAGRRRHMRISRQNQSERQLDRDRYECHGWASKQTGYDPSQRQTWRPFKKCRWSPRRPTTGARSMALSPARSSAPRFPGITMRPKARWSARLRGRSCGAATDIGACPRGRGSRVAAKRPAGTS